MNEELGIAYAITDGVPNMIPQAARMTHQNTSRKKWSSIRLYLKAAHTSQYAKYHLPFKRSEWQGRRFLSVRALTVLVLLVSSAGVYSGCVEEYFPQGCTGTTSLCFYCQLLPITVSVYVFFHLWTWTGINLFWHR